MNPSHAYGQPPPGERLLRAANCEVDTEVF